MGEKIEGQHVRKNLRLGLPSGRMILHLGFQLGHGLGSRTARRLIRRHHHAFQAGRPMQRGQGHRQDRRRTVWVGNQFGPLLQNLAVHFRHHQRHLRIHPESGGVIDDHRPGFQGGRSKFPRTAGPGAEKSVVHPRKSGGFQLPDLVLLSGKDRLRSRRTLAGQGDQFPHGKFPALQHAQNLLSHRPGHTDDGHVVGFTSHHATMP